MILGSCLMEERIIHSHFRITKDVIQIMGVGVGVDLIATFKVVGCVIMEIMREDKHILYLIIMHYVIPLHGLVDLSAKVLDVV
tara:strand:- start:899 stop:1147 length:249 start_codon:yes stop_codon:yes gene_type:complete